MVKQEQKALSELKQIPFFTFIFARTKTLTHLFTIAYRVRMPRTVARLAALIFYS
jgi:hypothetical protein